MYRKMAVLLFVFVTLPLCADGLPKLFTPKVVPGQPRLQALSAKADAEVTAIAVELNMSALESNVFAVPIGSDSTVVFVRERQANLRLGSFESETIYVENEDAVGRRFVLPITRTASGKVVGSFMKDGEMYGLSSDVEGNYTLRKIATEASACHVIPREVDKERVAKALAMASASLVPTTLRRRSVRSATPPVIHTLKVAVSVCDVFKGAYSDEEISLAIQQTFAWDNSVSINSLENDRVVVAGWQFLPCPVGASTFELGDFAEGSKQMQAFRREKESHMALLWAKRATPGDYTGVAYRTLPGDADAEKAFAVVAGNINPWNTTVSHELGHVKGKHHQIASSPVYEGDPMPYGREHVRCGEGAVRGHMSQGRACGEQEVRFVPYASNPAVMVDGKPFGAPNVEDNVRAANLIVSTVLIHFDKK